MTKNEYMKLLSRRLRRLPREDYDRAVEYFEEYFAEAGPENEEKAIKDLGTPEEAAKELIMDLAEQNAKEPPKTVRHGMSAVWVGILGICAAPVAVPIALALVVVIATLLIALATVLLSILIAAVCITAAGIISFAAGVALLFQSFPDALCNIGLGITVLGVGILCVYGSTLLSKWMIKQISVCLGKITKGGRHNENKE